VTAASRILSKEEIEALTRASDLRGALAVTFDWAVIAAALALAGGFPSALTIALAVVVIGGRQLGLAVLMHEAAHRSLFRTRGLNRLVGHWLCGAPIWTDLDRYRRHHLHHHIHTGTERDPDMVLVDPFPTTPRSLARKLARDLLGLTGLKRIVGLLAMDFDFIGYSASGHRVDAPELSIGRRLRHGLARVAPVALTNLLLLGACVALGAGWVYLLWVGAWLTTFSLFVRVRSIAEHACTERTDDMFRNTRSVEASWLARAFVAPHGVALHLEHHLVPTVPYFRLRELRALLRERGLLDGAPTATRYRDVLRAASSG